MTRREGKMLIALHDSDDTNFPNVSLKSKGGMSSGQHIYQETGGLYGP